MRLTEEEARDKWCPFARSYDAPGQLPEDTIAPGTNRRTGGGMDPWCLCIASKCMAWRWADEPSVIAKERRGYCGLAGGA